MVRLSERIGILGGTFDPPHMGHLILAQYTMESLGLNRVFFVPVGAHPFKGDTTRTRIAHRLEMVLLAIAGNPDFELSLVDIEREGPHYSADTVRLIGENHPQAELYFLMGGDNLRDFPTWTHADRLIEHAKIAVMRRSDEDISAEMHDEKMPGLSQRVEIVDTPLLSIWLSSTHIVERLQQGKSVRYLVPDSVLEYIMTQRLYSGDAS